MDVRERLQTPTGPDAAGDPDRARELFAQGRRRRLRRRAVGAGGTATLVLLAVVAWPGAGLLGDGSPGPVIDDVASAPETPEDDATTDDEATDDEVPTFDLPTPPTAVDPGSDEDVADPEASGQEATDDGPTAPPAVGDDDASTADRQQDPAGASDLVLADVRVGVHAGFDRVTLEFSGDGQAGWFTELGDQAIEHGKGREFDVAGGAVLTVFANMLQFPPDIADGTSQWDGEPVAAPGDAQVLTEIVSANWFEGQHQLFLGLNEPVPYRIGRLDGPERIVIDLLHPS